jgi:hypothetical protein
MAAGINLNNVWAARGLPIDVIGVRQRAGEPWDFHVGGSAHRPSSRRWPPGPDRYYWVRQKRLQGSHGTSDRQARAYNDLVVGGIVDPCLGTLYRSEEIPDAHDEMERGVDVLGNRVALVGAAEPGLGRR